MGRKQMQEWSGMNRCLVNHGKPIFHKCSQYSKSWKIAKLGTNNSGQRTHNSLCSYDMMRSRQLERSHLDPNIPNTPRRHPGTFSMVRTIRQLVKVVQGGSHQNLIPQGVHSATNHQRFRFHHISTSWVPALSSTHPWILYSVCILGSCMHVNHRKWCEFWWILEWNQSCQGFREVQKCDLKLFGVQSAHHLDSELRRNQNWEHHGQLWPNVNVIHLTGSALTHAYPCSGVETL